MKYEPTYGKTTHSLELTKKELFAAIEMQIVSSKLGEDGVRGDVPKIPHDADVRMNYDTTIDEEGDEIDALLGITVTWATDHRNQPLEDAASLSPRQRMARKMARRKQKAKP